MQMRLSVNFARPIPLFPLSETILLPHTSQRLHIFEPRYRQMVRHTLDQSGQICMACYDNSKHDMLLHGDGPPVRPAVCVGQIMQHDRFPDGRYMIELLGVCRAEITSLHEPNDDHLYRRAIVQPLEPIDTAPPTLPGVRETLRELMHSAPLQRLRVAGQVEQWSRDEAISTHALLEVVGYALLTDGETRYRLLAEGDIRLRARLICEELRHLSRMIECADRQPWRAWPKGMSWN